MKQLVEFPLEGDGILLVEVDAPEPGGGTRRSMRPSEVTERATQTFEEAIGKVRPVAEAVIAQLRTLADPPTQVTTEFGLKFTAAAGVVLASTAVEGNCKVTVTWTRRP